MVTLCDLQEPNLRTCFNIYKNLRLHNDSIHIHFHQNRFINKSARNDLDKNS